MEYPEDTDDVRKFTDKSTTSLSKRKSCIHHQINEKVIKITPKINFSEVLTSLTQLNLKYEDYPYLFVFIIQSDNLKASDKPNLNDIITCLDNFTTNRSIILKILSKKQPTTKLYIKKKNARNFISVGDDSDDLEELENLLIIFMDHTRDDIDDESIEKVLQLKNYTKFIKVLRTTDIHETILQKLILKCAAKGTKHDFLVALDGTYDGKGRLLDEKAQLWLSKIIYFENKSEDESSFTSVLNEAIKNKNEDIADFLISRCSHLIQELPFNHRTDISTNLFRAENYKILCDLIEISDFPFPKNLDTDSITDKRLKKITEERKKFHNSITSKNFKEIENFVNENFCLKLVYNSHNCTAINAAINSKNFEVYTKLISLGFLADEFDDPEDSLTEPEKKELRKALGIQTVTNVNVARPDEKTCIYYLMSRSLIHNRMLSKEIELTYRQKINKWYEVIYKIPLCSKFLDVASQSKDLKIIFDFESEYVKNVDLRHPSSLGTTHPARKWIFIGAKEKYTGHNKFKVEGVLIHEICHFVMHLVYENNDHPYYENDHEAREEFDKICSEINKWESLSSDDSIDDDECEEIISSVYTCYNQKDYHPELVVRPLQILVQYDGNESKLRELQAKYKSLFDYIENFVIPELNKYNQRNRRIAKKVNESFGLYSELKNHKLKFTPKVTDTIFEYNFIILNTNVPKLLLLDIYQFLYKREHLINTRYIFTTLKVIQKNALIDNVKTVLSNSTTKGVIIDCTEESGTQIKNVIQSTGKKYIFIVANNEKAKIIFETIKEKKNEEPISKTVAYTFDDLMEESRHDLLHTKIEFQNNSDICLHDLLHAQKNSKEVIESTAISQQKINSIINHLNQGDIQLLKLLIHKSQISINSNYCNVDKNILNTFQPRKFIPCVNSSSSNEKAEYDLTKLISKVENKCQILISDIPGAGKSWIFQKIANCLRERFPTRWINYIDLKEYAQKFTQQIKGNQFTQFMIKNILNLKNKFEKVIFTNMYENGKVSILFDGFSEIPKECRDNFLKLIDYFDLNKGNQLWIATREYHKLTLLQKVDIDEVYRLDFFSKQNGIDLISKTWEWNDRNAVGMNIKMEDYQMQAYKLCENVLKFKDDSIGLPHMYTTIAAYRKKEQDDSKSLTFKVFKNFIEKCCSKAEKGEGLSAIEIHQYFATINLFPEIEHFCDFKHDQSDWSEAKIMAFGLAKKKGENFDIHNESFRYFFVADFIVKHPFRSSSIDKNECFTKFVLKICLSDDLETIRMFLDGALSDKQAMDKFKNVLRNHSQYFIEEIKGLLEVILRENLINIAQLELYLFGKIGYTAAKEILISYFKDRIETSTDTKTIRTYQKIILNYLNAVDLKLLISDSKICHKIIKSNLDMIIFEDLIGIINERINIDFTRQALKLQENGTLLHLFFKYRKFDRDIFTQYLDIFWKYFLPSEVIAMLNMLDETNKSVLQICIDIKDKEKFKFICEKVEEKLDKRNNFRAFLMTNSNQENTNILHFAARCDDIDVHRELWDILLKIFKDKESDLKDFIIQNDANGDNFLHLLVKLEKPEIIKLSLDKIYANCGNTRMLFKSKNALNMNLLHLAIKCSKDLDTCTTVWNALSTYFKKEFFFQILKNVDDNNHNIVHLTAHYSGENIFEFIVSETEIMSSKGDVKELLKSLNSDNENIIQIAAKYNNDTGLHKILWKKIHNYLDKDEIANLINSKDSSGANVLFSAFNCNTSDVAQLIWIEIKKVIKNVDELNKYLIETDSALQKSIKYGEISKTITKLIMKHPHGSPENILKFKSNDQFEIENEKLKEIFMHPDVKNRKIVAFSVIGAFRRGKSFFLNYCLRYLYANYASIKNPKSKSCNSNGWLGDEKEPLKGFSWRSGSTRDTMGITLWNDVFLYDDDSNQSKYGIIVLDTQGLFDNETSPADNSKIFALGTLISSIQVLNLFGVVQEDQLQYLHFATEFAKFSDGNNQRKRGKCFQNLMFLIRDWCSVDDFDYGIDGGKNYLENVLKINDKHVNELKAVREFIKQSFDDLSCCLLPNPGKNVASVQKNGIKYNGCHSEMDDEFKEELTKLIEHLLSPQKLVLKKINQKDLTGIDYLDYVEHYFKIFQSAELPKAQSIYDLTVEKHMNSIVNTCLNNYKDAIKINKCFINQVNNIEILHNMGKNQTLVQYHESNKMGDFEKEIQFKDDLKSKIEEDCKEWKKDLSSQIEEKILEDQKKAAEKEAELCELINEKDKAQEDLSKKCEDFEELKIEISKLKDEHREIEKNIESKLNENIIELEKIKGNLTTKEKELAFNLEQKAKDEKKHEAELEAIKASKIEDLKKMSSELEAVKKIEILKLKDEHREIEKNIESKLNENIIELEKIKGNLTTKEKELAFNLEQKAKDEKKHNAELEAIKASKIEDIKKISSELQAVKQEKENNIKEVIKRNDKIRDLENQLKNATMHLQNNLKEKDSINSQLSKKSDDLRKLKNAMSDLKEQSLHEKLELNLKANELKTQLQERDRVRTEMESVNNSKIKEIEQLKIELATIKVNHVNDKNENTKKDKEIRDLKANLEDTEREKRSIEIKYKDEVDKLKAEITKFPQCYVISEGNAKLVDELKEKEIVKSSLVESVMKQTDRKLYCRTENPYLDKPQSIGYSVTISAPHMHAYALENLLKNLKPHSRVLDVGSGSGYLTMCFARFLLAQSVQCTGIVVGIDNIPNLVGISVGNLNSDDPKFLSSGKIKIVKGDGRLGCPQYGPYDVIHVGAASPEAPKELLAQLKPGGRMLIPIGPKSETQKLELYDKMSNGKIETTSLMNVLYGSLKDYDE